MRQILCLSTLLVMLMGLAGCGQSADAPPPVLSEAERDKKREEYNARMKQGEKAKQEAIKKPGG
jgi:outer membrane lipoprotein-sorting protein